MGEKRINIFSLKNVLRAELKVYDEKKKRYDDALYQKDLYEELVRLVNVDDINLLYANMLSIGLILPLIYDGNEAKVIESELYRLIYVIVNTQKYEGMEKEIKSYNNQLKLMVNKIIGEYTTLMNNISVYKKEYADKTLSFISCRKILYRLRHEHVIDNELINFINNLLAQRGFSKEHQILIDEYINHHNIKAKFKNPKLSFTTIKMIEDDFKLYDLEELMDKDIKDRLDSCSVSIYDSLMEQDDTEASIQFLDSMTSWMDNTQVEYVLKSVLNKFLMLLQECKNNMLTDGNYEDVDIRRVIIEEYNSYYYRYKKLLDYYNSKMKIIEGTENLPIGGGEEEEILPKEVKNHLFFAMGASKSYAERDIADMPEETYKVIKDLFEDFKYGTLPEYNLEYFVSGGNLKGYCKLKDKEVRIVCKFLGDNNYLVLGIISKKNQGGNKEYLAITNRDYNYDISTEQLYIAKEQESEEIYGSIIEYLEKNARKRS